MLVSHTAVSCKWLQAVTDIIRLFGLLDPIPLAPPTATPFNFNHYRRFRCSNCTYVGAMSTDLTETLLRCVHSTPVRAQALPAILSHSMASGRTLTGLSHTQPAGFQTWEWRRTRDFVGSGHQEPSPSLLAGCKYGHSCADSIRAFCLLCLWRLSRWCAVWS